MRLTFYGGVILLATLFMRVPLVLAHDDDLFVVLIKVNTHGSSNCSRKCRTASGADIVRTIGFQLIRHLQDFFSEESFDGIISCFASVKLRNPAVTAFELL